MKIEFKYYMHGSKDTWRDTLEYLLERHSDDELEVERIIQRADFPFYEIGFQCVLDTETGEVEIKEIA